MLTDGWGDVVWHVAPDISLRPRPAYIEERTGRKWDVNDGDFPL